MPDEQLVSADRSTSDPTLVSFPDAARAAARRAVDAIAQALSEPRLSQDALRRAVVRYGTVARDLALDPTEMLAALVPVVRRSIARLAPGEQAELQACVQWWAIHGYHRAD
jgi:hypothetical protein